MSMFTLIWSDTEGWPRYEQFESEKEATKFLKKEVGTQKQCEKSGYNPAPLLVSDDHTVMECKGYRYC